MSENSIRNYLIINIIIKNYLVEIFFVLATELKYGCPRTNIHTECERNKKRISDWRGQISISL